MDEESNSGWVFVHRFSLLVDCREKGGQGLWRM